MSNLFDADNYPDQMPDKLVVGDRWTWRRPDLASTYDPASYTLKYSLRLQGTGATEIEVTSVATDFAVEVPAATTAGYTAGDYTWQAYITRNSDSERVTVERGMVVVQTDSDSATSDPRSHAQIVLDAIEAVLEGRATKDQESYTVNGRSLSRTPLNELLRFRRDYKREVALEAQAAAIARGMGSGNIVRVRMP